MALVSDRCFCLRKIDYSETSQILQLFAREHGLIRVIAKGAFRRTKAGASKFGGGIDLLELADTVFSDRLEKNLAPLCEWTLLDGHLELRQSRRAIYLAQSAAEWISLLIEERDPHPAIFDLLQTTLSALAGEQREQAFLAFELALLREAGYLPVLEGCAECGTVPAPREAVFCSSSRGGIICRNCEARSPDRMAMNRRLFDMLQYFMAAMGRGEPIARLPRLTRHQTDPVNRILAGHVQYTLGRPLRMLRHVLA